MKNIQIKASGIALPSQIIYSSDIDQRFGLPIGTTEQQSGIVSRHHALEESATDLAVMAIHNMLQQFEFDLNQVDFLIAASGTMEQAIPCNAAKIHARLNLNRPIPAFDINMTCLSALTGLDIAASLIHSGQYRHILLVSSEVASVGINWQDSELRSLFGDGAAALLLSPTTNTTQGIINSRFETHSNGLEFCQIRGGGSLNHPSKNKGDYQQDCLFEMRGKEVYKLTASVIDEFVEQLFAPLDFDLSDINWVVPHQASRLAMAHIQKRLGIPAEKMINVLATRGNQVAASIPSALHELRQSKPIKQGG